MKRSRKQFDIEMSFINDPVNKTRKITTKKIYNLSQKKPDKQ